MTRFHLDTSVIIDMSYRREPARSFVRNILSDSHEVGICAVQVAELFSGLTPDERPQWRQLLNGFPIWEISLEAAIRAGIYRYTYARQGKSLSTTDTLIAAVAHELDATLVTSNVKDFPMSDIHVLALLGER